MHNNPLSAAIFDCLLTQQEWKIHTLATQLNQTFHFAHLDDDYQSNLFKRNFIIMNALFELDDALTSSGYSIKISTLIIELRQNTLHLTQQNSPSLRDYYLDWHNYHTDQASIAALLAKFWTQYSTQAPSYSHQQVTLALEYFELDHQSTFKQIQRQWHRLAIKLHPDKHQGDTAAFQLLQQHWHILKANFK